MRAALLAAVAAALLTAGCSTFALPASGPSLPEALLGRGLTTSIIVEVDAVAGRAPDATALDLLRTTLAEVTGKAVAVTGPSEMPAQGGDYDMRDLERIHRATAFFGQDGFIDGGRAVLHVLYLDGRMADDDGDHRTLGRSLIDAGVIAIFRDAYGQAHRLASGTKTPAAHELDRHVLLHEAGHALGLVGNIPMVRDHDADDHRGHSRYPESVMYFHPPMTPDQFVSGPVATTFDVDDLADLAAYRRALAR